MKKILQKYGSLPVAFFPFIFFMVMATCLSSCEDPQAADYTECTGGNYFSVFNYESILGTNNDDHFSLLPSWDAYRVKGNKLILTTPHYPDSVTYEAEDDIIVESIRTMPDGGIFFMDGWVLYYISPAGDMVQSTDVWAGTSTVSVHNYWTGAAFTTSAGSYGYVDTDGSGFRLNVRDQSMGMSVNITVPNIPDGDCLAAYEDGTKFSVIRHMIFLGTPYVRKYTFYKSGSTVYMTETDLQIPEETKDEFWRNFTPDGSGYATFDIYADQVIRHYKISLSGGAYTLMGETPRYIPAPDGYYWYENIELNSGINVFRVSKYDPAGQKLWNADIRTGTYALWNTYGWADSTGVFLVSNYVVETSSVPGIHTLYISSDGKLCD